MITVEPVGGLGNRMRAVESVIALGQELGRPVRVVWTRTPDLHCRFDALFEPLPGVILIERGRTVNRILRRVALFGGRYSRDLRQLDIERRMRAGEDLADILRAERSALLVTCSRVREHPPGFPHFVPVEQLRRLVDREALAFGPRVLGVHVRRTDHTPGPRRSPLVAFVERMEAEVAVDPATTFFVATDAPEVEARLRERYRSPVACCLFLLAHP